MASVSGRVCRRRACRRSRSECSFGVAAHAPEPFVQQPMSGSGYDGAMSEPRWWFLIGLVCACAEEQRPPAESTKEQEFGGAHESITEDALAFLREDILD